MSDLGPVPLSGRKLAAPKTHSSQQSPVSYL